MYHLKILEGAIAQMKAEIVAEEAKIEAFLKDPTLIQPTKDDEHDNPSYILHLMIHHLTENKTALLEAEALYSNLSNSNY